MLIINWYMYILQKKNTKEKLTRETITNLKIRQNFHSPNKEANPICSFLSFPKTPSSVTFLNCSP